MTCFWYNELCSHKKNNIPIKKNHVYTEKFIQASRKKNLKIEWKLIRRLLRQASFSIEEHYLTKHHDINIYTHRVRLMQFYIPNMSACGRQYKMDLCLILINSSYCFFHYCSVRLNWPIRIWDDQMRLWKCGKKCPNFLFWVRSPNAMLLLIFEIYWWSVSQDKP